MRRGRRCVCDLREIASVARCVEFHSEMRHNVRMRKKKKGSRIILSFKKNQDKDPPYLCYI